jgi:hypothetical protein
MRRIFYVLLVLTLLTACVPQQVTVAPQATAAATSTTTPKPTETATPIPLVEILPGLKIPENQIEGYYAKNADGKLLATQDIYGTWIKATAETKVPDATANELQQFKDRMGAGFSVNKDGTITGVDGVIVKENGEVIFTFDGKNEEIYHIGNMKAQDGKLMVAGYVWNAETKAWEAFNPGFPMEKEDPQKLGWFIPEDAGNGNLLRFYQRALETLAKEKGFDSIIKYKQNLFKDTLPFESWNVDDSHLTGFSSRIDSANDEAKFTKLMFNSEEFVKGFKEHCGGTGARSWQEKHCDEITKGMFPLQAVPVFGYLVSGRPSGTGNVISGSEILNGNEKGEGIDTTALFLITDETMLWKEEKNKDFFQKYQAVLGLATVPTTYLPINNPNYSYVLWPVISSQDGMPFPFLSQEAINLIDRNASEKKSAISGNKINKESSLYFFGAFFNSFRALFYRRYVLGFWD